MFTNLPLSVKLGLIVAILLSTIMIYLEKKFSIFKIIGVFIASVLLFMSIFSLGNNIYKIVEYPTYEATIVHIDTREKKDEDGYTYLMYQPTYTFNNGEKEIKVKSTMSTGGRLEIGAKTKIAYKNGEFLEYTEGTLIWIIALLIGLSITFFILFMLMGIAFNKEFEDIQIDMEELQKQNEELKEPMDIDDKKPEQEDVKKEQTKATEELDQQQKEKARKMTQRRKEFAYWLVENCYAVYTQGQQALLLQRL